MAKRRKVYKVRHFRSPYKRKNNKKIMRISLIVLSCVLIFAIAFWGIGPLTDMLYNKITTPEPPTPPIGDSSETSSENTEDILVPTDTKTYTVRYITEEEILLTEGYDALAEKIKADGFTAAVIPLKTESAIYFATENEFALRTKTVSPVVGDLISKLKVLGIKTIGNFETFRDNKLPRILYGTENISMAVRFKGDPTYLMLDGDNITWLSPASDKAKEYILAMATDAAKTGIDEIVFKNSNFVYNNNAYFSENDEALDKSALLNSFATALKEKLPQTPFSFQINSEDFAPINENKFGTTLFDGTITINAKTLTPELKSALENKGDKEISVSVPELSEEDTAYLKEKGITALYIG